MAKRWKYSGDVNLEHGGVFFRIDPKDWDDYDYCEAVRVTPCSDAGAQDNVWWVEELTVLRPKDEELKRILGTCGYVIDEDGDIAGAYSSVCAEKGTALHRWIVAEAAVSYGKYDITRTETVQIGKDQGEGRFDRVVPSEVLRGNASLERYVRREFLA